MNEGVGRECAKVQLPVDKDVEFIALTALAKFLNTHNMRRILYN